MNVDLKSSLDPSWMGSPADSGPGPWRARSFYFSLLPPAGQRRERWWQATRSPVRLPGQGGPSTALRVVFWLVKTPGCVFNAGQLTHGT